MRIQSFEHVPFEGLAALANWARARDHSLGRTRVFAGQPLPACKAWICCSSWAGP